MVSTTSQLFGMIRGMEDLDKKYDYVADKPHYEKVATFVTEFVQSKMVEMYQL